MLLPLRHENMAARRWPVVTLALIVLNTVCFLVTHDQLQQQGRQIGQVKAHLLLMAASHPELEVPESVQPFVSSFREHNPGLWKQMEHPNREVADAWDARMRMTDDPGGLQDEMDSLAKQYTDLSATALTEQYAFVPAHPRPLAYITANFLHGGWLHLIGNMWFLWLAGFVLEDAWGRALYSVVYMIAGAAALQVHAWMNPGSIIPTLGASGAVAALMGAFLVRFPKMRIDMAWVLGFRLYRFKAPAWGLLPLWLLMEVFYGALFGQATGVAHWAHVGGFAFGMLAAGLMHYTRLEHVANKAIEEQVSLQADPEIAQASEWIDRGQYDEALSVLSQHMTAHPDSLDACNLMQQAYWRKGDVPAYQSTMTRLCELHLKQRHQEAAWQDYEDFLNSGGKIMPAATWFELCRAAEGQQMFDRALAEYDKLAAAYPAERHAIMAQVGAGRLCLARLNRPQDALRYFEAAAGSPVPHLDLESNIEIGIREAKAAMSPAASPATAAARA